MLNNAIDFVDENGKITIQTELSEDKLFESEYKTVTISIGDNGKGIPRENIHSIFDPFFSTKPITKGTGLGLSISKTIAERHDGKLEVDSQVGKGTTFFIHLPLKI